MKLYEEALTLLCMKIVIVGQFACSDSYTECFTFDLHHFNVNIKAFLI